MNNLNDLLNVTIPPNVTAPVNSVYYFVTSIALKSRCVIASSRAVVIVSTSLKSLEESGSHLVMDRTGVIYCMLDLIGVWFASSGR
jgi:hypothetical protein